MTDYHIDLHQEMENAKDAAFIVKIYEGCLQFLVLLPVFIGLLIYTAWLVLHGKFHTACVIALVWNGLLFLLVALNHLHNKQVQRSFKKIALDKVAANASQLTVTVDAVDAADRQLVESHYYLPNE